MTSRSGASLIAGGVLSLAFHVLYQVGHGPTEVNEHGVVLGLTNDQWSHLGFTWTALIAVGVWGLAAADREGRNLRIVGVVVVALLLQWVSTFVWALYVLSQLLLAGARVWLAVDAIRRRILPLWSTAPTLVAITAWLLLPIDADRVFETHLGVGPWQVQYDDILGVLSVVAWVALGVGSMKRAEHVRPLPAAPSPTPVTAAT